MRTDGGAAARAFELRLQEGSKAAQQVPVLHVYQALVHRTYIFVIRFSMSSPVSAVR